MVEFLSLLPGFGFILIFVFAVYLSYEWLKFLFKSETDVSSTEEPSKAERNSK